MTDRSEDQEPMREQEALGPSLPPELAGSHSPSARESQTAAESVPIVPAERKIESSLLPIGRWSPVDPAHQKLMHWTAAIRTLVIAVILGVVTFPLWDSNDIPEGWWWLLPVGLIFITGLLAFLAWYWPPKAWEALRYRVDETGIEIRSGVWWQSSTVVACSRIQHTEVVRGPLQRSQDLASLVIHTAGNANDTVVLPGLRNELAQALRDWLIAESAGARQE